MTNRQGRRAERRAATLGLAPRFGNAIDPCRMGYDAGSTTPATPERKQRPSLDPARFPNGAITDGSGLVQVLGADVRKGANTPYHWRRADATSPQGQSHAEAFLKATQAGGDAPTLPPEVARHALRDIRRIAYAGSGSNAPSLVHAERRRTKRAPADWKVLARP
ncbi:MAG: hypothetical protein DPW18_16235 [Chloroflexi bacterium]|nr:hypothetical protein [Chloroflexota bacterium]